MVEQHQVKQETAGSQNIVKPPVWLNQIGYWFRIGLTVFTALSLLLGTVACSSSSSATTVPASWQLAERVTQKETLTRIVQEHSSLSELKVAAGQSAAAEAIKKMRVWQVKSSVGQLNLYDFNNSALCGTKGCLYVGYLIPNDSGIPNDSSQMPTEVFAAYLDPHKPPKTPLFKANSSSHEGLPCLEVNQLSKEGRRQLQFCYDGLTYQLADSQLFKGG